MKRSVSGDIKPAIIPNTAGPAIIPSTPRPRVRYDSSGDLGSCVVCGELIQWGVIQDGDESKRQCPCWYRVPAKVHLKEIPCGAVFDATYDNHFFVKYLVSRIPRRLAEILEQIVESKNFFECQPQPEGFREKIRAVGWNRLARNPFRQTSALRRNSLYQDIISNVLSLDVVNEMHCMTFQLDGSNEFPNLKIDIPDIEQAKAHKYGPNVLFSKNYVHTHVRSRNNRPSGSDGATYTVYNADKVFGTCQSDMSLKLMVFVQRSSARPAETAFVVVDGCPYPMADGIAIVLDGRSTPVVVRAAGGGDVRPEAAWYGMSIVKRFGFVL